MPDATDEKKSRLPRGKEAVALCRCRAAVAFGPSTHRTRVAAREGRRPLSASPAACRTESVLEPRGWPISMRVWRPSETSHAISDALAGSAWRLASFATLPWREVSVSCCADLSSTAARIPSPPSPPVINQLPPVDASDVVDVTRLLLRNRATSLAPLQSAVSPSGCAVAQAERTSELAAWSEARWW